MKIENPDQASEAGLSIANYLTPKDLRSTVAWLHPEEKKYLDTLKFERRRNSFLIGRFCAKKAIGMLAPQTISQEILVRKGVFDQPVVSGNCQANLQVSISHCDHFGAAIAFFEAHPMGIDIERVDLERVKVLETQVTKDEINLIGTLAKPYEHSLTLLWTIKEALSKVLKTGLSTPFEVFEINKIDRNSNQILSHFKNFTQYKAVSFFMGNYVCSIVLPKTTEFNLDYSLIHKRWA